MHYIDFYQHLSSTVIHSSTGLIITEKWASKIFQGNLHLLSWNDNLTHLGWTLVDVLVIAGLGGGVPPPPPPPPVVNKGSAEPFSLAPLSKLFPPVFDGGLDESWLLDVANTSSCSEGECRQGRLNWEASYHSLMLNLIL